MARKQFLSPFVHEGPIQPHDLCDRADELADLSDLCRGGRFVKLLAPRRYGKTSLLCALFDKLQRNHNLVCLLCDLDGVVSRNDLAARLHDAYADQLQGNTLKAVREYLAVAGISLTVGGPGLRATLGAGESPGELLETLLDIPRRIAERTGEAVVVAFDEFQVILALESVDGLLRSKIQHQLGKISYVFCGSEPSMMERLFSDRARPLYGQAIPMRLGRLPRSELLSYIDQRFAAGNKDVGRAIDPLLDVAKGHPQRAMLLAHGLWNEIADGATGDSESFAAALDYAEREVAPECEAIWRSLEASEQRALRAIAEGHTKTVPASVYRDLDLPRQTFKDARERLIGAGLLDQDSVDRYRFVDPLFERWLKQRSI